MKKYNVKHILFWITIASLIISAIISSAVSWDAAFYQKFAFFSAALLAVMLIVAQQYTGYNVDTSDIAAWVCIVAIAVVAYYIVIPFFIMLIAACIITWGVLPALTKEKSH
jgi:hypothetical protein